MEIIIGGKKVHVVDRWEDVTTEQFMKLCEISKSMNMGASFSILSSITIEELSNEKVTDREYSNMINALSWIEQRPNFSELKLPESITINNKKIVIPTNLELETYGQRIQFELTCINAIQEGGDIIPVMNKAIAIYLYPIIMGTTYNGDKLNEAVDIVNTIPIIQSFPIACFFFNKWLTLSTERALT